MLKKLTQQYRKHSSFHKIVLGIFLSLGFFVGLYSFATTLPFGINLNSMFGITGDSNYSTMHFAYGGNNFAGIMFWFTGTTLSIPQHITINGGTQAIDCYEQLNGIFYNNERGRRMRPLDVATKNTLQNCGVNPSGCASYGALTLMTGGLYTNCVDSLGASYVQTNEVYGSLYHQRSGTDFWLIAGVDYNFPANQMLPGSLFSGSLRIANGQFTGQVFDSYGGIADIMRGTGSYCGDGILNGSEQCDDGNQIDNDGCSSSCQFVMPTLADCSGLLSISPSPIANTNSPVIFALGTSRASGIGFSGFVISTPIPYTTGWTNTGIISYTHYFSLTGSYTGSYTVRNNYSGSYLPLTCPWSLTLVSGATICQSLAVNPTILYTGQNATFTCTGQNVTGYTLSIYSGYVPFINLVYTSGADATANSYYRTTGGSLPLGNYTAVCTVHSGTQSSDCLTTITPLSVVTPICSGFSTTPDNINVGTDTAFTCQGNNVTGYRLDIYSGSSTSGTPVYTDIYPTTEQSHTWTTGASLPVGTYTSTCTLFGGSGTGLQCTSISKGNPTLHVQLGCNSNFQADVTFGPGSHIINIGGISYYTNLSSITVYISVTEPVNYVLTGDFLTGNAGIGIFTGVHPGTGLIYPISFSNVPLDYINNRNYFHSTYKTGTCTYTDAFKRIYVDQQGPTLPTLLGPINGTGVCASSNFQLSWTPSIDTGAGLASYTYHLYNSGLVYSGPVLGSGTTGIMLNASAFALGNYSRTVTAYDNLGNPTTSATGTFVIGTQYCGSGTCCSCCCLGSGGVLYLGSIPSVRDADLNKAYLSDVFYAFGISGPTQINVSNGMLFINGSGVGSTGMVNPGDKLQIDLISSNDYDTTVSSFVSMSGYSAVVVYNVTTRIAGSNGGNCNLTTAEEQSVLDIYNSLKDQYTSDPSQLQDFLDTFQSMVQDNVDLTNDCSLQDLLDLIQGDINNPINTIDTSIHIAPNCKEYNIGYDNNEGAYYSPDMKNRFYFVNRETLIRHIDYYNPGDCHINTYGDSSRSNNRNNPNEHIAPNGKIYTIQGSDGAYTCAEFLTPKYFNSLDGLTRYVDSQNPAKEIWNHQVDTTFTPITYMAPNGKEYKIYKTNRGYMSYKLMKVKYYETLSELESYITKQNPPNYTTTTQIPQGYTTTPN